MKVIKKKLLGVFACMLMLCAVGQMCAGNKMVGTLNNEPLVTLIYEPHSHDFGEMGECETDSTVFEIWRGGGCCALAYTIHESYECIEVFPTSGESHGERDPITVTINTAGLALGSHTYDIHIESNGGNGIFTVTVTVVGAAEIEIEIFGGLGVTTTIKNVGNADVTNVEWSITITGGLLDLINKEVNGTIPILTVDGSSTVESGIFFGIGPISITVIVTVIADSAEKTVDGTQFIIITFVQEPI